MLVCALSFGVCQPVFATSSTEIQEELDQIQKDKDKLKQEQSGNQSKLEGTRGKINNLTGVMDDLDAEIEGLDDEFFVIVPDTEHPGNYLPYLFVVLEDGYSIADIENQISEALEPHMQPVEIIQLPERPFFHFKTNRIGLTNEILKQRTRCGVSCS